ncbi:helix-turn-helix domain-containing protein [Legionella cardiaca]|uniref:Helix-turn-helix domain-containing protein n=1 Tax=Legionella cardiaca TaxID=1071983 RepID=A0ABY8ASY0_9GAMM|nr:helix-turn-helix domain-containing protein [Legionella cardiaca]WED43790.1 helix-turn-helix domain-containing protein [Legionella cardiaca]
MKEHNGNRQQVAAILGVSERTLRYKLAKMREEGYAV